MSVQPQDEIRAIWLQTHTKWKGCFETFPSLAGGEGGIFSIKLEHLLHLKKS